MVFIGNGDLNNILIPGNIPTDVPEENQLFTFVTPMQEYLNAFSLIKKCSRYVGKILILINSCFNIMTLFTHLTEK